jgi:ferredoxin
LPSALDKSAGGVVGQDIADVGTEIVAIGVSLGFKVVAQCWFEAECQTCRVSRSGHDLLHGRRRVSPQRTALVPI